MASTDGTALLRFGTQTKTGWVVVEINENETSEDLEIPDEDGDVITHVSNFGKKTDVSLTLIAKSGTTMVASGEVFTYSNHSGATKTIRLLTVGNVQTQKDAMRTTVTGKLFSGITPS